MSSYTIAPYETRQYFDDDGAPLAGGFVYTYASGTSTPIFTYSDASGTQNQNPVELDSAGRCSIYLAALSYKFIVKDANLVTINTVDPVSSVGLITSGVYEIFTFGGDSTSPITASSYPSGTTYDTCHAGTAWYAVDSSNLASGTYKLSAMLNNSGGTTTVALVNLSDGAPDTPIATCASTSTTGANVLSSAITFATGGSSKNYAIKTKVSAATGFAWGIALVKTA